MPSTSSSSASCYFFFHTLLTVPYLASLSEIVTDENSRVRVASWQTVFNTGSYVLVFVVAPLLFSKFGVRGAALMLLPSFLTFIGPLLVIKEDPTDGSAGQAAEARIPLWESFKQTLTNRTFLIYMSSVATFFFGLQLFLGGLAFMAADMMGISESQLGLMNAAAFAPIPIMLIIFNLMTRKWGAKAAFRAALLVFAVAMLLFPLSWTRFNLPVSPLIIGIIASGIGSFSIGAFFTIPYAFPAHIAAVDAAADRQEPRRDVLRRPGRDQPVHGRPGRFCAGTAADLAVRRGRRWAGWWRWSWCWPSSCSGNIRLGSQHSSRRRTDPFPVASPPELAVCQASGVTLHRPGSEFRVDIPP